LSRSKRFAELLRSRPGRIAGRSATGFTQVLSAPRARALLTAFGVSYLGDAMSGVTVAWLAIEIAPSVHQSLFVGAAVAAYSLPGVIGAFVFARIMRRQPTRLLVVADSVLRAALLGTIAVLRAVGALSPTVYIVLLAVSSLLFAWGLAGRYTLFAELVGPELTLAANSLQTAIQSATFIIGPGIAGVLVALLGAGPLIGVDAVTYVWLAVVALRAPNSAAPVSSGSPGRAADGLRLMRAYGLVGVIALTWLFDFLYGPVEVALPLHVSHDLHHGAGLLGLYWALFGAGAAVGNLLSGLFKKLPTWPIAIVIIAGWGACLLPFAFSLPIAVTVISIGVGGLIYGPYVPLTYLLIQSRVPLELQATVFAARAAVVTVAAPLGTAFGGPLTAALGAGRTIAASGLITVLAAIVIGGLSARASHRRKWRHVPPEPSPS
jgi:predicted MFS family arabinose efflux permease